MSGRVPCREGALGVSESENTPSQIDSELVERKLENIESYIKELEEVRDISFR